MIEIGIKYRSTLDNDIVVVVAIEPPVIEREGDIVVLDNGKKWDEASFLNYHVKCD